MAVSQRVSHWPRVGIELPGQLKIDRFAHFYVKTRKSRYLGNSIFDQRNSILKTLSNANNPGPKPGESHLQPFASELSPFTFADDSRWCVLAASALWKVVSVRQLHLIHTFLIFQPFIHSWYLSITKRASVFATLPNHHALWSLNLVQVTESISGSFVPLAMFKWSLPIFLKLGEMPNSHQMLVELLHRNSFKLLF